jgi:hypothetical protein
MKNNHYNWAIKTAALFILAANASAQEIPDNVIFTDSTNRVSLSLRFGLNINAKFKGVGGSLNPAAKGAGQYDDGYVLTDVSGNAGGQTWNWGYDNASQVNTGNNTVAFNRTTAAAGNSSSNGEYDSTDPGFELAYDRQLGVKEDWHNMRYGIEGAFNYQPISIHNNSSYAVSQQTDVYGYTAGTTPPSAPYQGSFNGPGFVINSTPSSSTSAMIGTVSVADNFDANLWGFRLGPYVEFPFGKQQQFTLSASVGLAVGLLDAHESWNQTVTIGASSTTTKGGGNNFDELWGGYASLNADYQLNKYWGVIGGVQFQDLGTYNHSFNGRQVSLDLSQSVFLLAGVSFNF